MFADAPVAPAPVAPAPLPVPDVDEIADEGVAEMDI
jgi:hypothetical protein